MYLVYGVDEGDEQAKEAAAAAERLSAAASTVLRAMALASGAQSHRTLLLQVASELPEQVGKPTKATACGHRKRVPRTGGVSTGVGVLGLGG